MVNLRALRFGKFYRVIWEDIIAYSSWVSDEGAKQKPARCVSYGWVTDRPKGYIRLSATLGDNLDGAKPEYTQHIVIPIGCILDAEEIRFNEASPHNVEGS